jgi:hypothetical protein
MKINNSELLFVTIFNIFIVVVILLILRKRNTRLITAIFTFILAYYVYTYQNNVKIIYISIAAALCRYILEIVSTEKQPDMWKLPFWALVSIFIITIMDCFCIQYPSLNNNSSNNISSNNASRTMINTSKKTMDIPYRKPSIKSPENSSIKDSPKNIIDNS